MSPVRKLMLCVVIVLSGLVSLAAVARSHLDKARPLEWTTVAAAASGTSLFECRKIAGRCDLWFGGARPEVVLHFASGTAADDSGHTFAIRPELWKGIIQAVRTCPTPLYAMASLSGQHPGASQAATHAAYRVHIVDDQTLRFQTMGSENDEPLMAAFSAPERADR